MLRPSRPAGGSAKARIEDPEALAHDGHLEARRLAELPAFPFEVGPVDVPPILQGEVAFALVPGEIRADLLEGQDHHGGGLEDGAGLAPPGGGHAQVSGLHQVPAFGLEEPEQVRGGPLGPREDQGEEAVGQRLGIGEVEGVVEAGREVLARAGLEGVPEAKDVGRDRNGDSWVDGNGDGGLTLL